MFTDFFRQCGISFTRIFIWLRYAGFLSAGLLGAIGCGTNSNPVSGYQNVVDKQSIPANQVQKPASQFLVSSDFYTITVDGGPSDQDLVFYEGQANQHTIVVKLLVSDVKYKLHWVEAESGQVAGSQANPPTAFLQQSPTAPDTWILNDTIGDLDLVDNEESKKFPIQLELEVLPGTSVASAEVLNKINRVTEIEVLEMHTQVTPTVTAVAGLESPVDETDSREFTVDVTDPGSGNSVPPEIRFYKGTNDNQQKYADGSALVRYQNGNDKPESLGDDKWRFHLEADAKDSKIDHSNLNFQTTFKVYSRSGLSSPAFVTHYSVKVAPAPSTNGGRTNPAVKPTPPPAAAAKPTPPPAAIPKPSATTTTPTGAGHE